MEGMETIKVPVKKPRNPLVPGAATRKAGKHVDKRKKEKYNPKHPNKQE